MGSTYRLPRKLKKRIGIQLFKIDTLLFIASVDPFVSKIVDPIMDDIKRYQGELFAMQSNKRMIHELNEMGIAGKTSSDLPNDKLNI